MGNAQPKKTIIDLNTMRNEQFCNFMRGMIKRDTTYAFELNEFK